MYMWRELESCLYPALTCTLTVLPAGGRVRLLTDWQSCRQQHRAWLKDRGGRLDNQEEKIRHFLNNENQYVLSCVCWGWCFICLTGSVRRIERTGKWWYYIIDGWKDRWLSSLAQIYATVPVKRQETGDEITLGPSHFGHIWLLLNGQWDSIFNIHAVWVLQ